MTDDAQMAATSKAALSRPAWTPGREELAHLLCDVAQLLDGWHNDGTVWTAWDESVRQRVSTLLSRVVSSESGNGTGLDRKDDAHG